MRDIAVHLFWVHRHITHERHYRRRKSPGCGVITEKSTERASIRGGVPVLNTIPVISIHEDAEQEQ